MTTEQRIYIAAGHDTEKIKMIRELIGDNEKEVNARVEFNMDEFKSVLKNTVAGKYRQAWDMTLKSQYKWEAFEEFEQLFNKEIKMPTPYDDMHSRKKWEVKEAAINSIRKELEIKLRGNMRGRDFDMLIRRIVKEVELAQDF